MPDAEPTGSMPVSELTEDAVVRIAPEASLEEVADALVSGEIGVLVVGVEPAVTGIISERDLVRAVSKRLDLRSTRAVDVANVSLVWCDATATIDEVAAEMMEHYVRHVLVEEDGRLVGVVSARDLLGAYAAGGGDID